MSHSVSQYRRFRDTSRVVQAASSNFWLPRAVRDKIVFYSLPRAKIYAVQEKRCFHFFFSNHFGNVHVTKHTLSKHRVLSLLSESGQNKSCYPNLHLNPLIKATYREHSNSFSVSICILLIMGLHSEDIGLEYNFTMDFHCQQTQVRYRYLANIFFITVIKETTK